MEKYKKSYKTNKLNISAPKWNDGPHSVSDNEYILSIYNILSI